MERWWTINGRASSEFVLLFGKYSRKRAHTEYHFQDHPIHLPAHLGTNYPRMVQVKNKCPFTNLFVCVLSLWSEENQSRRMSVWGGRGANGMVVANVSFPRVTTNSSHRISRTSLSFRPKRVLYLSKRHWRDLTYIAWYWSTTSWVGASTFGTVMGSPTGENKEWKCVNRIN